MNQKKKIKLPAHTFILKMSNDRFDLNKPILESLFDHAQNNLGKLDDRYFEIALDEYNMNEDIVMQEMMDSKKYKFTRYATGWTVKER